MKPNSEVKSDAVSVISDKDSLSINATIDEECDISFSEDDIPLFDLQKRLRGQVKIRYDRYDMILYVNMTCLFI